MEASTLVLLPFLFLVVLMRKSLCLCNSIPPKTYPVIGCLLSFYTNRNRLLDWYTELLTESPSGTVIIKRLAARRTVVTANPSNVEYILKKNFDNYPKGKPFTEILGDFLGDGIFNVDGNLWLKQRRLATHDFTPKSLREYVDVLRNEVEDELLSFLDAAAQDSQPFDLQELLRRFTFNIVCIVFLGIDPSCSLNPSSPVSEFDQAFQTAAAVSAGRGSAPLSFVWKLKKLVGFGSEKDLRNAVQKVHSCVNEIIREKKKKINTKSDFLSRLIVAGESDEAVRDMVISVVMAGRDTTSAVTTRLFSLISCHKTTECELVNEIRWVKDITGGGFDYESLKKLSLLKACLCEVMRLYPPVPWDSKHALTHDRLPDGTPYVVASMLNRFHIEPIGTDNPVFVPMLTAHMAGGMQVRVRRRDGSR
ncbi:hypothetical protein Bca52824_067899 [Brassica carinata]|uniref:Cytochrome P450 n=1 Tax=Brassica carinata TaxID=52824 RepID=A0A8X7UCA0_BRACI|nr:hypothetical protein Bca52824_067899 [Brassica carinata]